MHKKLSNPNIIKVFCLLTTIALGIVIGWHTLATPTPVPQSAEGLSAYRMADHLRIIAAEERSALHYERRMYVRDYIIDYMEELGLTAEIDNFTVTTEDLARSLYTVWGFSPHHTFFYEGRRDMVINASNVLFRQQGRSDTAIMLIAHIDSAGVSSSLAPWSDQRSPGASDSGYGLAVMLEIARYFAGRDLENSIYFFFTDLEELGLVGALRAAELMDFSNVNMILNLEARGIRGPVYMFETNAGDFETMRFFREAVSRPVTYSIAVAIYRSMPNDTDLTPFLDRGFAGMNFASLNNLLYYHTEYDSYENISHTTMQHYVDQIGGIVELFASDPRFSDMDAFVTDRAGVFFSLPFGILVLYNDQVALVISITMFALTGLLLMVYVKQNKIKILKVALWTLVIISAVITSAVLGLAVSHITALITGIRFHLTWMFLPYTEMRIMWPSMGILAVLFGLLHFLLKNRFSKNEMALGAMALLSVINLALSFIMVEATFLVAVPLVMTFICFVISEIKAVRQNVILSNLSAALPLLVTLTLFVPIVFTFTLALTIGGLAILMALFILMVMSLPPLWRGYSDAN